MACGVQFCMKSLFWRQSVVRRVCLAFNTVSVLFYEVFVLASISCKEGVSSFWRRLTHRFFSVAKGLLLLFNTLSQYIVL